MWRRVKVSLQILPIAGWSWNYKERLGRWVAATSSILKLETEGSVENTQSKRISMLAPAGSKYPSTDWPTHQARSLRFNVLPAEFPHFLIHLFNFLVPPFCDGLNTLCMFPIVTWKYTTWISATLWVQSWIFLVLETLELDFWANIEQLMSPTGWE